VAARPGIIPEPPMNKPDDVAAAIQHISMALRLEHCPVDTQVLDEYVKRAQQDANFRYIFFILL
jgi:hypothetical protein